MARMDGEYALHTPVTGLDGRYSILRKRLGSDKEFETIIPDAGINKEFAMGLVSLLNSQGSQAGQTPA